MKQSSCTCRKQFCDVSFDSSKTEVDNHGDHNGDPIASLINIENKVIKNETSEFIKRQNLTSGNRLCICALR